jgi:transcriptional regulator with GAF, ATPase, and Fis domain
MQNQRQWPDHLVEQLSLISQLFADALARARAEEELRDAFIEIGKLKKQLEHENICLREEVELRHKHEEVIGQSESIRAALRQAEQVAETDATILILGETGTGKEVLARAIHRMSFRRDRPMVRVNCAALPPTLIESELFGREKGAYTGALSKEIGRFEIANGATIFLDEVSEIPPEVQGKLLTVLQDGQFERLGSSKTITVDVRVIAATNQDLARAVREGRFREDLYYRLNVFPISVPPLRERREDIPLLVWAFIKEFGQTMAKTVEIVPRKDMELLHKYSWPGNVRELKNIIERAMIICKGPRLSVEVPRDSASEISYRMTLREVEKHHITEVLKNTGWRVRGKNGAAEILGLKPTTLDSRIKRLSIERRPEISEMS